MVSIGFRVSPTKVTYALVRETGPDSYALIDHSVVFVPPALETPRQLQFVRTTLLDIMEEYAVLRAGLRLSEGVAQQRNPFRLNLEGVVQELLASSSVGHFVAGPIATIASLLGVRDRTRIKELIAGTETPPYAIAWDQLTAEAREAVLMAIGALKSSPGTVTPAVGATP